MTPPPNRPASGRRRRTTVEVYFLLYLSSIILLLGTTTGPRSEDNLHSTILELLAPDFRVEAEKPALLWRFFPAGVSPDSTLATPLEQDSTNIITAFGTVADLRFAIVEIADTLSGRSLPVEMASLTRIGDRSAVFAWRPTSEEDLENRVYRVTVTATGRPIPPRDISAASRRQIMEILEQGGTVADSVTFTVNLLSVDRRGNSMIVETPTLRKPEDEVKPPERDTVIREIPAATPALPPFGLQASNVTVKPGFPWTNEIRIDGQPGGMIEWRYSPNAQPTARSSINLKLRGTSPVSGAEEVFVTAIRTADGMTATAQFTVSPEPVDDIRVRVPQVMYVGEKYTLDFRGAVPAGEVVDLIVNEGGESQRINSVSSAFPYTPRSRGKVDFTRSANGTTREFSILVEQRPLPDAPTLVSKSEDEMIIRTVCYGRIGNQPNRTNLVIEKGNAETPIEIMEARTADELNRKYTQQWRVRRKPDGERFAFTAYALDQRGSSGGKSAKQEFR